MVAIVSGNSLGLSLTSLATLGQVGSDGAPAAGRGGEQAFVNIATGNLVLQTLDDELVALGPDAQIVRTYNSLGALVGLDGWAVGPQRQSVLPGTGGTLVRTDRDGAQGVYTQNAQGDYVSTAGSGAFDTIRVVGGDYLWTDGDTGLNERYSNAGQLLSTSDADGNTLSYGYVSGRLSTVTDASGEVVTYDYNSDNRLGGIHTSLSDGTTVRQVGYVYDQAGRLSQVTVDLTPENNSDARSYKTIYSYDGDSDRLANVSQTDGSSLSFTYKLGADGQRRVGTVTNALGEIVSYSYDLTSRITTVVDAAGTATVYQYDTTGQLVAVQAGNLAAATGTTVITVPATQIPSTLTNNADGTVTMKWLRPAAADTGVVWHYRALGAQSWTAATPTADGASQSVALPATANGSYEYELLFTPFGSAYPAERAAGSYVVDFVGPGHWETRSISVQSLAVQTFAGPADGESRMEWAAPAPGVVSAWRYRLAGDPQAAWTTRTVATAAGKQSVDLTGIAPGAYEFDLVEMSGPTPVAQACGTFGVTPSTYTTYTTTNPAQNPVFITTAAGQPQLSWPQPAAGTTTTFKYKNTAGVWVQLAVSNDAASGKQLVSMAGVAAGSYQYEVTQSGSTSALGRGTVEILPTVAGHTETQSVPVSVISVTTSFSGLGWPAPSSGTTNTFRYRYIGDTTWSTYTSGYSTSGGLQIIPSGYLPRRNSWIEFEVYRTPSGSSVPTAHATGAYYTTGFGTPTVLIGQVVEAEGGPPVVRAPTPTTRLADVWVGARVPARELSAAVVPSLNANNQSQLSWDTPVAGTTTTLQYRVAGGQWQDLAFTTDTVNGKQVASLAALAAGTYEYQLNQTGATLLRVSGTVQTFAKVATHTETRQVSIGVIPVNGGTFGLGWTEGTGGATTSFRYRASGSTTWWNYSDEFVYVGDQKRVEIGRIYNKYKWVEFEIVQTASDGTVNAHATGRFYNTGSNVTVETGQVAQDAQGVYYISNPATTTTMSQQVSVPDYWAPPTLTVPNSYFFPSNTPAPTITLATPATRAASVWIDGPKAVISSQQQVVTTANVTVAGLHAVRRFVYDNLTGDVLSVANGAGETTTLRYDARGNQIYRRDAAGNVVERTYTANNQLATETRYRTLDLDGDGAGLPTGAMTTRYTYDPSHATLLRFVVSGEGRVTEYRYDAYGQRTAELAYSAAIYTGNLTHSDLQSWAAAQASSGISRVDMHYDARGMLDRSTRYLQVQADAAHTGDAAGATISRHVYDAHGRVLFTFDGANAQTSYLYDGLGRVYQLTDALGQVSSTEYDDAGNRITATLVSGLLLTSVYDKAGRLVSQLQSAPLQANLGTTTYAYDADGRVVMRTEPGPVRSFVLYDGEGRKVADVDGDGTLTEYRYDAASRVTRTVRYATAVPQAMLYAGVQPLRPKLADVLAGLGQSASDASEWRSYDAAGRLAKTVDAEGYVTEYSYDGASRLLSARRFAKALTDLTVLGDQPGATAIAPVADVDNDRVTRNFYDADGLLVGALDAEGYLTKNDYDATGRVVRTTAYATVIPLAERNATTLDGVHPTGDATQDLVARYFYNGKGQRIGEVDAQGYVTEYRFDAAGRQCGSTRYATAISYNAALAFGQQVPATTTRDQTTSCVYDALGRVLEETNAEGIVTRNTYEKNNLVATTAGVGRSDARTQALRYDVQGRLIGELNARGYASLAAEIAKPIGERNQSVIDAVWAQWGIAHAYDDAGRRISSRDQNGNRTLFFYDADGRLTHTINAEGEVVERTYDTLGNRTGEIRYANRAVAAGWSGGLLSGSVKTVLAALRSVAKDQAGTFVYDRRGLLTGAQDGEGVWKRIVRNAFGEIDKETQADGVAGQAAATRYTYDRRGLLVKTVTDEGGFSATTRSQYDAFGRLRFSFDANNNQRELRYDQFGRVVTQIDPAGGRRVTSYDAFNRVVSETDELLRTTSYAYDLAQRTVTVTTPEGISVATSRNAYGQVATVTDGRGVVTAYEYDADGSLTRKTIASIQQELNEYDRAGLLWAQRDANGVVTRLNYDSANRVVNRTLDFDGLRLLTGYTYDAIGRQLTVTDGNGVVTEFTYDRNGRLKSQTLDKAAGGLNLTTEYGYDSRGNLLTVKSPGGSVTRYEWDNLDRRQSETADYGGKNLKRSYEYDLGGNVRRAVDAAGNVTRYVYDSNDRLIYTLDPAGGLQRTDYDAAGRVTRIVGYAKSVTVSQPLPTKAQIESAIVADAADHVDNRLYDKDGRLVGTVNALGEAVRFIYDATGNVVERIAFAKRLQGWTPGSNAVPAQDPADQWVRTAYDSFNRAVYSLSSDGSVLERSYDANGNVVQQRAYANRLANPAALDAQARPLPATNAADARVRNVYDTANRLVRQIDGTGAGRTYEYDANGNLIESLAYAEVLTAGQLATAWQPGQVPPLPVATPARDAHTRHIYDAAGRMLASATAQGIEGQALKWAVTKQTYDANGNVTLRTSFAATISSAGLPADPTQPEVASWINAVVATPALDHSERMTYDTAGRLVSSAMTQRSEAGVVLWSATRQSYDANSNVVSRTDYASFLSSQGLGANPTQAAVASWIDSLAGGAGSTQRMAYDSANRLAYRTDAVDTLTQFSYDTFGNVTQQRTYAATLQLSGTFTAAAATQAAAGMAGSGDRISRTAYDTASRAAYQVDGLGGVTEMKYDGVGNLTSTKLYATAISTSSLGSSPSSATLASLVSPVSSANDRSETQTFDAMGRLASRAANGSLTTYVYDGLGRVTTKTVDSASEKFVYDAAGRVKDSTDALENTEHHAYDALGNKVSFTNKLGAVWTYEHDAAGRLTQELSPEVSVVVDAGFTAQARQMATRMAYDGFGNLVSRTEGAWDADHGVLQNARTTQYGYDLGGHQVHTVFPTVDVYGQGLKAPEVFVTYDALGNAIDNQDVGGKHSYKVYDRAGRVLWDIDANGYVTGYVRDSFGAVKQLTRYAATYDVARGLTASALLGFATTGVHNADRVITTEYDVLGRTMKVIEPSAHAFDQNTLSNVLYMMANRVTDTTYNVLGDVLRISVYGRDSSSGATVTAAADTYFKYDNFGRRTAQLQAESSTKAYLTTYAYDATGNLTGQVEYEAAVATSASAWNAKTGMGYAAPGNPTPADRAVHFTYDKLNRKLSETRLSVIYGEDSSKTDLTTRYEYDAVGNLVLSTDPLGTKTYTYYDALGRVEAVTTPSLQAMRARVAQLYVLLFNRAPENAGLEYWLAEMQSGQTFVHIAGRMYAVAVGANGWTSPQAAIDGIYANALSRPADSGDAAGREGWVNELNAAAGDDARGLVMARIIDATAWYSGADPRGLTSQRLFNAKVAAGLKYADQGGTDTGQVAVDVVRNAARDADRRQQIAQVYLAILGRAPEAAAVTGFLTNWPGQEGVAAAVFASAEGQNLLAIGSDSQVISRLYQNVFGKPMATGVRDPGTTWPQYLTTLLMSIGNDTTSARLAFNNKVSAALPGELAAYRLPISPLTEFDLDIYGNVVRRTDRAGGVSSVTTAGYTVDYTASTLINNRVTTTTYDTSGHALNRTDAEAKVSNTKYDIYGHVVRESRDVTNVNGVATAVFTSMEYDNLGQVKTVTDSLVTRRMTFNAFGELTTRTVDGEAGGREYYDYDNAGHLWRTNAGDGVDKVMLYDIAGHQTAELRSATRDLKAYANAAQAVTAGELVRTETKYDLLGHAILRTQPTMFANDVGTVNGSIVSAATITQLVPLWLKADVTTTSYSYVDNSGAEQGPPTTIWVEGVITAKLTWASLAGLGSGEVKIELTTSNGSAVAIAAADQALTGYELKFAGTGPAPGIERVIVSKKNLAGEWVRVMDTTQAGEVGTLMRIDAPADPTVEMQLLYRVKGSSTQLTAGPGSLVKLGDAFVLDISRFAEANYDYTVQQRVADGAWADIDTGSFTAISLQARRLITQLYVGLLNRAPEAGGLAYWVGQFQAGVTLDTIAQAIYSVSPLYQGTTDSQFVQKFYSTVLGRAEANIAPAEVAWWVRYMEDRQLTRGALMNAMISATTSYQSNGGNSVALNSQQMFNNKVEVGLTYAINLGGYDIEVAKSILTYVTANHDSVAVALSHATTSANIKEIAELYVLLFNRAPDAGGLSYWQSVLASAQSNPNNTLEKARAIVAQAMYSSGVTQGAYSANATSAEIVTQIYTNALGRAPDAEGLAYWVAQFNAAGSDRGQVLVSMVDGLNTYGGTQADGQTTQQLYRNKVVVAVAYSLQLHGTLDESAEQVRAATAVLSAITATPLTSTTVTAALAAAQATKNSAATADAQAQAAQAAAAGMVQTLAGTIPAARLNEQVASLYVLLYNRAPDYGGLVYWRNKVTQESYSFERVAQEMYATGQQPQFAIFPNPDTGKETQVVQQIFQGALGRTTVDASTLVYWAARLAAPATPTDPYPKGRVFLELIGAVSGYAGVETAGVNSQRLLANKIAVGIAYALLGGQDVQKAKDVLALVTAGDAGAASAIAQVQTFINASAAELAAATLQAQYAGPNAASTNAAYYTADWNVAQASADEASYYLGVANSAATSAASVATSKPTADNRSEIARLYAGVCTGAPDLTALNYWTNRRSSGDSAELIANEMVSINTTDFPYGMSTTDFVKKVYLKGLGRAADTAGLDYWVGQIATKGVSRGKAALDLLNLTAATTNTDQVSVDSKRFLVNKSAGYLTGLVSAASSALTAANNAVPIAQTRKTNAEAPNTAAVQAESYAASHPTARTQAAQLTWAVQQQNLSVALMNDVGVRLGNGTAMATVAQQMLDALPTTGTLGSGKSNSTFIYNLYVNAFGSAPDQGGWDYWTGQLTSQTRGQVTVSLINAVAGYTGTDSTALARKNFYNDKVTAGVAAFNSQVSAAKLEYQNAVSALSTAQTELTNAQIAYPAISAASTAGITALDAIDKGIVFRSAVATAQAKASIRDAGVATAQQLAAAKGVAATVDQRLEIGRLFAMIYNRAPTAAEMTNWLGVRAGKSAVATANDMLASPELTAKYSGKDNFNFVRQLFISGLGRSSPDAEDVSFWANKITGAYTRGQVAMEMIGASVAFTSGIPAGYTSTKVFTTNVATYLAPLVSDANAAQAQADLALANAKKKIADPVPTPAGSETTLSATGTNLKYMQVSQLFTVLVRRAPTPAEATSWVAQMQQGKTFADVAQAVLTADTLGAVLYPASLLTDANLNAFVTKFYQVALGRSPDAGALSYWQTQSVGRTRGALVELMITTVNSFTSSDAGGLMSQALLNHNTYGSLLGSVNLANAAVGAATAQAVAAKSAYDVALDVFNSLTGINDQNVGAGLLRNGLAPVSGVGQYGATPQIVQTVDRWGNVLTVSDARNSTWTTKFSYDANNQLLNTIRADGTSTSNFYDKLGRLIAQRDGLNNVNRQLYDDYGNLVEEQHADGGVVQYHLDVFGQRLLERKANGELTAFTYDKLGRMATRTQASGVKVDTTTTTWNGEQFRLGAIERTELTETYSYDELGRRIRAVDASGAGSQLFYDAHGNVVHSDMIRTDGGLGQGKTYEWDRFDHKKRETQADGKVMTWTSDAWGRVLNRTDLAAPGAGTPHAYSYNSLGQVATETSTATGQNRLYTYDNSSGLLVKIEDKSPTTAGTVQVTQYAYDAAGNRTREKTSLVRNGAQVDVTQDNHIAFDKLGRVSDIADSRYSVNYSYDANGNRIYTRTTYLTRVWNDDGSGLSTGELPTTVIQSWNAFDAMNRQTIVDGIQLGGGVVGIGRNADGSAAGQQIAYDNAGNRILSRQAGTQLVRNQWGGWQTRQGDEIETYTYDAAGRLSHAYRDGLLVDARYYDKSGHILQTGSETMRGIAGEVLRDAGVSGDIRVSLYDPEGQIQGQSMYDLNWSQTAKLHYEHDATGRLLNYIFIVRTGEAHANRYDYVYRANDATQTQTIVGHRLNDGNVIGDWLGTTENSYDANGFLIHVEGSGSDNAKNTRDLMNDVQGRVLRKTQRDQRFANLTHVVNTLIANDEVIGSSSDSKAPDEATFGNDYVEINDGSLTAGPSAYTVRTGETLQSIAKAIWGDANLWYAIGDANGLNSVSAGQIITIPAKPNTQYNDFQVYKPYDPTQAVGDTTPVLPAPQNDAGCGGVGQIIMIVVAIVATIFTAGAAAGVFGAITGATGGVMSTGLAVLGGAGGMSGFAAAVVGGAVGSIASQAVGVAIGAQDKFSWKGVALSALSAGVGSGVGALAQGTALGGSGIGATMARAAIGNTVTQGIGVATGLQNKFDWRGVAASAAAAGIGQGINDSIMGVEQFGPTMDGASLPRVGGLVQDWGGGFGAQLAGASLKGLVAGTAAAVMRGGKVGIKQVATDAFGNALGQGVVDWASGASPPIHDAPDLDSNFDVGNARDAYYQTGKQPIYDFSDNALEVGGDGPIAAIGAQTLNKQSLVGLKGKSNSLALEMASDYAINPDYSIMPARGSLRLPTQIGSTLFDSAIDTGKGLYTLTLETGGALWNSVVQPAMSLARLLGRGVAPNPNWFDSDPMPDAPRWAYRTSYGQAAEGVADFAQLLVGGYTLKGIGLGLKLTAGGAGLTYSTDATATPSLGTIRRLVGPALGDSAVLSRVTYDGVAIVRTGELSYSQVSLQSSTMAYRNQLAQLRELDPIWKNFQEAAQEIRNGYSFQRLSPDWRIAIDEARLMRSSEPWIANRLESAAIGSYVDTGVGLRMKQGLISGADDYMKMRVGPDLIPRTGQGLKLEITNFTPSLNAIATHASRYSNETMRYILYRGTK